MTNDLPLFDPYKALEQIRRERQKAVPQELSQKLSQPTAKAKSKLEQQVDPTFATFATFADGSSAPSLTPARVKEEERKENSIKSYTYAREGGAYDDPAEHERLTPAKVAKAAKNELSCCEQRNTHHTQAAKVSADGLRKWRAGLNTLNPEHPPCPGYRTDEWFSTLSRALSFLDAFGTQAEAFGWTASRLFGVHAVAGIVRVDACGALVLPVSGPVRAITATEIAFGHLTHREKPGQPAGVPWWEWSR